MNIGRHNIWSRVLRNAGWMLGTNFLTALLAFSTLSLNARALGSTGLGILAITATIFATIDRLCSFETWRPVITIGVETKSGSERSHLADVTMVAFTLDVISAAAAFAAGILVVHFTGSFFGIPDHVIWAAEVFMAPLLLRISGFALGLLRLQNRFALTNTIQLVEAIARLIVSAVLMAMNAGLSTYLLTFGLIAALINSSLLVIGLAQASQVGVKWNLIAVKRAWLSSGAIVWKLSWLSSASGIITMLRQNLDMMLVSSMLGAEKAGVYHVANRLASVLLMGGKPLNVALFAENAHLAAAGQHKQLVTQVIKGAVSLGTLAIPATLALALVGQRVLVWTAGPGFEGAYIPLLLLTIANFLALVCTLVLQAILFVKGYKVELGCYAAGLAALAVVGPTSMLLLGISGAGVGQIAFNVVVLVSSVSLVNGWFSFGASGSRS